MILSDNLKTLDLTKELILVDNVNLPFTSLLLKNGRQKITDKIFSWDYEKLDSTRGLAKEGSDVTEYQASDRTTGNSNVAQILRKSIKISDTAQSVSVEHINDIFAHEITNRISEIKRDLEYYLINGVKDDGTTGNPRQMNGLLQFVDADNKVTKATLTIKELQAMAKLMKQAGTASQDLVLLCDYNTFDIVTDMFFEKTMYAGVTNEFGSPLHKLNLTYASVIPYVIDTMPQDTALMVNMDFLKLGELRALTYSPLAKTGSAESAMIEMENGLKVLHPSAITQYSKA